MPADWTITLRLDGQEIGTRLAATGGVDLAPTSDVVAVDSLAYVYGRETVFSGSDGDTLTVALLVRNPAWLSALGMPGGRYVTLTVAPPAGHKTPHPAASSWAWPLFVGRVVPESVTLKPADRDGDSWLLEMTALDLRAWSASLMIGQPAWPAETLTARLGRLDTLCRSKAGLGVSSATPAYLAGTTQVSALDVDRRPLADMLDELAAGFGLCWVWAARSSSTPPILQLGHLATADPVTPATWRPGVGAVGGGVLRADHAVLPGNVMSSTEDTAQQSVGAVNEVRVNYTAAVSGTESTYVAADLASQSLNGLRSMTVDSPVTIPAAAQEIGDRLMLLATRLGRWRHPPVTWSARPPAARPDVTVSVADAAARAAVVLAGATLTADAPAGEMPSVYLAGSIYNKMPAPPSAAEGIPVPWWQIVGGTLDYAGGQLGGTLNVAPRYCVLAAGPLRWADLVNNTITGADLRASLVESAITADDLVYFQAA